MMAWVTRKKLSGLFTVCVLLFLSTLLLQSCFFGRKSAGNGPASAASPPVFSPEETHGSELFAHFCNRCHPGGMKGRGPALITKPLPGFLIKTQVRMGFGGMTAFPGFKWQARRRARVEVLERFALISWWDGRFPATVTRASYPDVGLVHVHHNAGFGEVVILYRKAPTGFVAYGHAAGSNLASATSRAAVELIRCEHVIARHRARGALEHVTNHMELRCLHFASAAGHTEFLERAYAHPDKPAPRWQTVFDGEIRGPWTHWTTVWRHCVEMPTYDYLNRKLNFFYW